VAATAIPGNLLAVQTSAIDPSTFSWQAKTNCTLSLGSGGRNGDGTLKVTSSAAGEAQAQTTAAYPIVSGQEYFAFADASGATVPERIGIQWLTSTYTQISITWALTTAAASTTWHRISVAGIAPAGAARARVILSSMTPAGAGVINYFENVYLGAPLRTPGNLLSFDAEAGAELDLSTWAAEANCTLSRVVPVTSWPVDFYYAGGHQLQLSVTAGGDASILCVERAPVTEGVEYLGFAYLNPPTSGSTCWTELRFYDGSGAQLSASRSVLAAPGTGWYRQIASAAAPAGAVTASLAVGITAATAGQVVRTENAYVGTVAAASASSLRTGSVLPKVDWDFEQGIGAWTVVSGVATLARSTPWGTHAFYNFYSLTITSSTASTSVLRSGIYPVGDAAGQTWLTEVFTKVSAGGWTYTLGVRWYDAASALISTTTWTSGAAGIPGWWYRWADFTAPAWATTAQMEISLTATSASSVLHIDRPALWRGTPTAEATPGTETASVQLVLRELEPGYTMTVYRVTPDGARAVVRGPDGMLDQISITSDAYAITDYEAPLGIPVYYQAEIRDPATGTIASYRATSTVLLPVEASACWLKDPVEPQRNTLLLGRTPPTWQRSIDAGEFRVRGRRNTVVLTDVRGGLSGEMALYTRSDSERAALHWLLDTGHPLLVQTGPGTGIEDMYVQVGEATEQRITSHAPEGWRTWTLNLTQVDRPTGGQAGSALRTWQDVRVENATWGDVLGRYASWLEVLLDRPEAG
jgi:hypothetical protein